MEPECPELRHFPEFARLVLFIPFTDALLYTRSNRHFRCHTPAGETQEASLCKCNMKGLLRHIHLEEMVCLGCTAVKPWELDSAGSLDPEAYT